MIGANNVHLIWSYVTFPVEIVIFFINLVITVLMIWSKQFQKKLINKLLVILFIAHVFTSIFNLTSAIGYLSFKSHPNMYTNMGYSFIFVGYLNITLVMCVVFAISFDRFVAVQHPFVYLTFDYRYPLVILISTLLVLIAATVLIFTTNIFPVFFGYTTFFTGVVMCVINLKIYHTLKRHFRVIQTQQVEVQVATIDGQEQQKIQASKRKHNAQRETIKTRICFFVAFSYIILWLPALIRNKNIEEFTSHIDFICGYLPRRLNSLFDPLCYILLSDELRANAVELFCRKLNRT